MFFIINFQFSEEKPHSDTLTRTRVFGDVRDVLRRRGFCSSNSEFSCRPHPLKFHRTPALKGMGRLWKG